MLGTRLATATPEQRRIADAPELANAATAAGKGKGKKQSRRIGEKGTMDGKSAGKAIGAPTNTTGTETIMTSSRNPTRPADRQGTLNLSPTYAEVLITDHPTPGVSVTSISPPG